MIFLQQSHGKSEAKSFCSPKNLSRATVLIDPGQTKVSPNLLPVNGLLGPDLKLHLRNIFDLCDSSYFLKTYKPFADIIFMEQQLRPQK